MSFQQGKEAFAREHQGLGAPLKEQVEVDGELIIIIIIIIICINICCFYLSMSFARKRIEIYIHLYSSINMTE